MIEYLPWSNKTLNIANYKYKNGHFSILDIELGGMCNLNCIYCDSPDRNKIFSSLERVNYMISTLQFDWIFICGLGEPTFSNNKNQLIRILEECKKHGIKCSIFTNLIEFDDVLYKYIYEDILYIMFKLDTFDPIKMKKIYRRDDIDYNMLNTKINKLTSFVKVQDNCTNICASIVPTTLNYDELPKIIDFCLKHNIFPLLGDLENSGKGQDVYDILKLNDKQLKSIKSLFKDYIIPICPSVLYGIHILYNGSIAVDKETGLSCHWFWLEEPKIKILGDIKDYDNINDIEEDIKKYRLKNLDFVRKQILNIDSLIFGGCGGDIKYLLQSYIELYKD